MADPVMKMEEPETPENVQPEPTFDEALNLFGEVADGVYAEAPEQGSEGPMHEGAEGPEVEAGEMEGGDMTEYFGPELSSFIEDKIKAHVGDLKAIIGQLVKEEMKAVFAPIRQHNEAIRAKAAAESAAKAEAAFLSQHPRFSEPAVMSGVQENMSKYPGMDKSTAYKLTISLLPAQDLAAQAAMPGMGTPMPNKPAATPKTTMDSWFNRKTK